MFKSDEEVNKMLDHENNGTKRNLPTVEIKGQGKGSNPNSGGNAGGKREKLDIETKSEIAVLANLIGTKNTAEMIDKHPSAVSHYKNGHDGLMTRNPELIERTNSKINAIKADVLDKAGMFLSFLDEEKAAKMKGTALATCANKMVEIHDRLTPKIQGPNLGVTVIFHAPRQRSSQDYSIIEVEPIAAE